MSRQAPRLSAVKRRAIAAGEMAFVRWGQLFPDSELPALCEPVAADIDLPNWAGAYRADIEQRLLRHGAILFRGFSGVDVATFDVCMTAISGGALEYRFRASPRTQVQDGLHVYTSTDYPAEEQIFPHNEHSYSPVFPRHLYLYCETPARSGGETPLGDTRALLQRIRPDVKETFLRKKILYVRNYGDGMGLPWRTVFQTDDRQAVETYCASVGIEVEWKRGDRLRTRQTGPAIVRHPESKQAVWFNHATFFNEWTLPTRLRDPLRSEFSAEELPQNTFFGDGSAIGQETIAHLQQAYRAGMLQFAWQKGDVLLLDNILTMHARNSFVGPRRILTGMALACRNVDLEAAAVVE